MKTRFFLLCALMGVLVACNKNENEPQQVAFQKGQKVTLRINASLNNSQNAPRRVSGDINVDGELEFAWEAGDEIQVIVGGQPATFTMTSFEGATAEFTGDMPAAGTHFDVTYTPDDAPDAEAIKQQTASDFAAVQTIDKKYFSLKAANCELGGTIELEWIYSAVKVTLGNGDEGNIDVQGIRIMPNMTSGQEFAFILTFDPIQTIVQGANQSLYIIVNDFDTHSSVKWNIEVKGDNLDWNASALLANQPLSLKQFQPGYIYQLPPLTLPTPEEEEPEWD